MREIITVDIRALTALSGLRNAEKRIIYAYANAVNNTALDVQLEEKRGLRQRMQVRKSGFIERQVAVISFASVRKGVASASIMVGKKPRLLLPIMEVGGDRPAFKGRRVAVPLTGGPARPSIAQSVVDEFTFKSLRLIQVGARRRRRKNVDFAAVQTKGGKQFKGAYRTFILPWTSKAPEGGVFQRTGPGRSDIRLVYSFKQNVHLKDILHWLSTARRVIEQRFPAHLHMQIEQTLKRAASGAR